MSFIGFAMTALLAAAPAATNQTKQPGSDALISCKACSGCEGSASASKHDSAVTPGKPVATQPLSVNDQILEAEKGNPESPDYRNRDVPTASNPNLEALEAESPDNPQPGKRAVVQARLTAAGCGPMMGDARRPADRSR
jgi:hypothetical protein